MWERPSTVEQVKVRARRRGWAGRVAQRRRKIGHVHRRCDAAASAGIDPEKYLHNLATAYAYMSKRQPNLLPNTYLTCEEAVPSRGRLITFRSARLWCRPWARSRLCPFPAANPPTICPPPLREPAFGR